MITSLIFFFSCDEDYISSLSQVVPSISLEASNNLSNLYLGEDIDNLELILKIEDSPSISSIGVTVNYNADYFNSESMEAISIEDNFFYNEDENVQVYESPNATLADGFFMINLGLIEEQENNHVNGDGEIARLYLSGKNIHSDFNIVIDEINSWDFEEYENIDDWSVENLSIGAPIPEVYFDGFTFSEDGSSRLSVGLNVSDLPKTTSSQIVVSYDHNNLSFVNYDSPIEGDLTNSNFDLSHSESESGGEITFTFNQQPGNNSYIQGDGSLVILDFDVLNQDNMYFSANYNEAVYDICGGCDNPIYSQHYDYDVSFWGSFSKTFEWYGCTDLEANNYNEGAIFDNGSCEYDSQEPQEIGD